MRQSLAALADPDVLVTVDAGPGEAFDPAAVLRDTGLLFLLVSAVTSGYCAPLVAAFIEEITETARTVAARATAPAGPAGAADRAPVKHHEVADSDVRHAIPRGPQRLQPPSDRAGKGSRR